MRSFCVFLVAISVAASLLAQHEGHGAAATATLEKGLGAIRYPVSTKNGEAQRYFDQGMRYVYGFNHDQAVASFKKATQLDPDLAMAYWGMALALGPNINMDVDPEHEKLAYEWAQVALQHAPSASEKERGLINALVKRYTNDSSADLKALSVNYSKAMAELCQKYPDDVDIATLYAESLMDLRPWRFWTHDGKPNEGTEEIVRVLEGVLKRAPNHTGANHYYIHAVEASRHPEKALKSAERLQTLAPTAGHLVHMPAHIFQRTGNYSAAAMANVHGANADRQFIKKYGGEGIYPLMYYNHNLHFGSASYMMIGQFAEATRLADEVGANASAAVKELPIIEPFVAWPVLVRLRFGRWADVLRVPDPAAGPVSTAMWLFARGVAFARLGNVAGAESERKQLEKAIESVPAESMVFQNSPKAIVAISAKVLDGRIAEASGDYGVAISLYRDAVELEDALNYNEPADWFYPVRETLGAALLRSGKADDAAQVFRNDLQRNPNNPRSLFGLAEALERRGKGKESAGVRADLRKVWMGADTKLRIEDF